MKTGILIPILIVVIITTLPANTLKIAFTSDVQGSFQRSYATWMNHDFPPPLGGVASLYTLVKRENPDLLFDVGNFLGIGPKGDFRQVSLAVEIINYLPYDAMGLGIEDLFGGVSAFKQFMEKTNQEFISSSLVYPDSTPVFIPYRILEIDNLKIGVFSILSSHADWFVPTWALDSCEVISENQAAQFAVDQLRQNQADIIIGLNQASFRHDTLLANSVEGIDIIFSGFDGFAGVWESSENHTVVCRIHTDLSSVGLLELQTNSHGDIVSYKFTEKTLFTEEYPPHPDLLEITGE
ncbi:MAG: hypothetical protein ACP5FK_05465 [bacterium]